MAHQAGAYSGLYSLKRLGAFLLPPDWIVVHRGIKIAGTYIYTWVERGTMRVKCLAQQRNAVPWPGLEPGPPDTESNL